MIDNRTNEPTPEQIERAYRAFCEARLGRAMTDEEHEALRSRLELTWIGQAIAAAQGAAPQSGRKPKRLLNQLNRIADALEDYEFDGIAADAAAWMRKAAKYIESERHLPAPVLPSSGVDEDALAEVIEAHVIGEPNGGTASWAWVNCSCGHRVEVAGVTREHVVALGRKHQARAVAEWLKGQGR